jgi:hypothetical protein
MVTMKRKEIVDLRNALQAVAHYPGIKFAYAVAKNCRLLDGEIADMQKTAQPSKEFEVYDKERVALCSKWAEKMPNGEPVIRGNQFVIPDEVKAEFDAALLALNETNKAVIDSRQQQAEAFDVFLLEEVEIEVYKVAFEVLPEAITGAELNGIFSTVAEPVEAPK